MCLCPVGVIMYWFIHCLEIFKHTFQRWDVILYSAAVLFAVNIYTQHQKKCTIFLDVNSVLNKNVFLSMYINFSAPFCLC